MSSKIHKSAPPAAGALDEHSSIKNSNAAELGSGPKERAEGETLSGVPPRVRSQLPGPPVEPMPRRSPLPASFGQQRLWFVAQMFPEAPTYNEPIMVQMVGPVDATVLARSLSEITRRHEAWRTVFTAVDGQPMQQVRPPGPFQLPVIDLTSLSAEQREPEALRLAANDARRPFDLREGPLVRGLLLRLTETDSRLIVTAHHIIVDGVSFFHVFLPELHALYIAFSNGQPSPLPDPLLQYADFAVWQRRWLTEEELAPKLAYWRAHMAGLTELRLPTDYERPNQPPAHGARARVALSVELMESLRQLGRRAGVTLFTTLLSAWKTLLFRHTGQGDVVVGSAAAGRPRPELDRLIGFFNNNLVLRTQIDGSLTFLDLLARVHEVLRAAREHQDVPFDRLLTELSVARSPNKSPLYSNVFILMPPLAPLSEPPRWSASRFDCGTAKLDLYLELHQRPSGLVGHIEYATELFKAATIERLIGHFQTLLEAVVRDPAQRLSELPLLTEAERQQLSVWQGPRAAPVPDSNVVSLEQLFEAQAARSPEAIAVTHGEERLTYEELNTRANQLAHYLRSRGVGPDTLVGLCATRTIHAMVGILGVLKAGGAYVPLDPAYPSERLRFIVEDADIKLLLTDARNVNTMAQFGGPRALLDEDWPAIAQHSAGNPAPLATADDLAYVIYTSGSSGHPKGTLIERRGLYHLAKAQERMFGLGVGTRVLQFFSLNFDVSVWELTITWPVGATLVIADPEALLPGLSLVRLLREEEIHVAAMTPSALMVTPFQELAALHTLITAGEVLPEDLVRRWAPGRRFFNGYGPTETTVVSVIAECRAGEGTPPIGRPFDHVQVHILDDAMRPVPIGVPGELYLGGPGVARGYLNRPDLTAAQFIRSPFPETAGTRLYKTGDRVKWRSDGSIDYIGRIDRQIKLRGFRIELGEIEVELCRHPAVKAAAVELLDVAGDKRLVAYVVPHADAPEALDGALKAHLRARLPEHMVPPTLVTLDRMPVNPSGKIDRAALAAPASPERSAAPATTSMEQAVAAIWREVLAVEGIGVDAPFFEVGGHSLALALVQAKLSARLRTEIDLMTLMRLPTIRQLAAHLTTLPGLESGPAPAGRAERDPSRTKGTANADPRPAQNGTANADPRPAQNGTANADPRPAPKGTANADPGPTLKQPQAIAIIGMAIRAPGVRSPAELWEVVRSGRETIRALDPNALIAAGADPGRIHRPEFVPAEGVLDDADRFDAVFFDYSDADATLMDPQQRLFLESAYEALEHAGCDPARFQGRIGVFGGVGPPLHWLGPVMNALRATRSDHGSLRARTLNAPDFLALRVAFKLGLRGPAITVQTACSTSLAAVHLARQSLLAGECDVALAGGVTLSTLREADWGYLHDEGSHESADGHCRPFDADASGMVKSSGAAIVVMKRLPLAISDRDTIHAVVLGSAMNNDGGGGKLGFTAPSEDGISDAIQQAYEVAGVDPGSVHFVEAHGTGTRLGDPIEVRALTRAYRRWTEQRGFCALGSLKANLGHLDAAASAAGLIKAALTLAHEVIPPVAGFRAPNPLLNLPMSPFYVNDSPRPWPRTKSPRRAGVNAMGVGGTNVHVVLEEAPAASSPAGRRPFQLLCFSARTETALAEVARRLGAHLADHPSIDIADVAHTLAVGRAQQRHRATMVCQDASEAQGALAPGATPALSAASPTANGARAVVFLFPGHGVHYLKMGLEVYETEPIFRAEIDRCFDIVRDEIGLDLRPLWLGRIPEGQRLLEEVQWAQPLLFAIEYALARQIMAWGARPAAMLGHSLGEYVAACIAGVFSLRDALALVATRGRLIDATPPGGMLAVFAELRTIEPYLGAGVVIATHAPGSAVLSGLADDIEAAHERLANAGIETSRVRASRAGHSPVMRGIRDAFRMRVAEVELRPPAIPIVSNVTGRYLTAEQATSPDYWADHLCSTVRLADGLGTLLDLESPICVELGPGITLGSFLKAHPRYGSGTTDVVGTLPSFGKRDDSSCAALLRGIGRAWELGVEVDWRAFYAHEQRCRIPLPTYPFEGRRFVLGAAPAEDPAAWGAGAAARTKERPERPREPGPAPSAAAPLAPTAADGHGWDSAPDGAEQLVESVWRRLLGGSHVPVGAKFFELGGDSLLAVQLLSELRVRTGVAITVRQFIAQPTVDGIAALLRRHGGPGPAAIPTAPLEETETAPVEAPCVEVSGDPFSTVSDEAAVRALIRQYMDQTMALSSASLVENLWAQGDACALVAIDGRIIVGSEPIQKRLARGFAAIRGARMRLHDERVLVLAGGQAACVTALLDSDLTLARDGSQVSYRGGRVSWVLEKVGDAWRVVHAHYSLPVGENPETDPNANE